MRTGTPSDAPLIRTLFANAYVDDPLMRWVFPDDELRVEATAAWLGAFIDRYVSTGRFVVADDGDTLTGAAIWRWPADGQGDDTPILPSPGGVLRALVGDARAHEIGAAFGVVPPLRPPAPYAYLHFLAVDAAHRRHGVARTLVTAGVDAATRDGLGVVLETTNPDNHPFYRALGFNVVGTTRLGGDGPEISVMATGSD
jgi:ribosomal protein S18 acetylase RimI-like enzyme